MKIYIATPVNARKEKTLKAKQVAAKLRVIELMDKAKVRWAHISHPVKNSARIIHNQKLKNNETK